MKWYQKVLGLSLVMVLLVVIAAGCGVPTVGDTAPAAPTPAPAATEPAAPQEAPSADDEDDAPLESVTLQVLDWSDGQLTQRLAFHEYFMERNPHINVEYTQVTVDQFRTSIITMIRAGDAPDVFPIPGGLTLGMALNEGWYQPLTPLLTEEFIATIDPRVLVEGQTMRNGVIYTISESFPINSTLFFYNRDVLDAAGITELPTTYSEFLDVARRVTEAGNGQFFGIIDGGRQLNRLNELARALVQMSGGQIAHANLALTVDGRAPYDMPEVIGALEFINQLVVDGSFHPDSININAPEAREMFAQGQAAFICQGVWCIGPWAESYPDLNFGVMAPPRPDNAAVSFLNAPQVPPWAGVSLNSEHPQIAAQYLMALFSEEYGYQTACVSAGIFVSIIPEINERYMAHPVTLSYFNIAQQLAVPVPIATQRDAAVFDFYAEVIDVQPNLASIVQGVLSGSINDIASELTQLADAATIEWQRASDAIGLDFGMFEFPNWVPGTPYEG